MITGMGRPRHPPERTAAALLDAAERIVEAEGVAALTLRHVADAAGTTTRAVYSVFGAKDGLLVALGVRAFDLLGTNVRAAPTTDDPAADLVEAGLVFRRFAVSTPPSSASACCAICRTRGWGPGSARRRSRRSPR